jgi:diacylglycerol kinase (ATP)
MPKNPTKLIVNPNADLGRAWRTVADLRSVIETMGGADWTGTVYPTHAIELARQAAEEGYRMVVAVGGDGTVHEVINGLMQVPESQRPCLGIVPLGSGNDFAHALGVELVPSLALQQVLKGEIRQVDVAVIRDDHGRVEYWNNTLGMGFDTSVLLRSRRIPIFSGFPVYFLAVLQTIMKDNEASLLTVNTDNGSMDKNLMMLVLCNGPREGGGFLVSPASRVDDGFLDYVCISQVSRLRMFQLVPEVMKGTHLKFSEVQSGKFQRVEIQSDRPLYIHTDGEIFSGFGTDIHKVSVEILPGALKVVV